MKKITVAIFFILAFVQLSTAQNNAIPALTDQAIKEYKSENFEQARTLINQSIKSVDGENDAYTWHFRGYIYRHFFNQSVDDEVDNDNREAVITSFHKSIELDKDNTFTKSNLDGLKSISNSFWNEAVTIISDRDKAVLGTAEDKFKSFDALRKKIGDESNLEQYTINFYKAFASANRKLIDAERANDKSIEAYQTEFDRVVYSYKKVLAINPEDYVSNYNLAINLYNEGAYIIEQLPDEADIITLIDAQQKAAEIFKKALPYATKADNIRPNRIETVKALRAIYLAMNNYEKFDHYNTIVRQIKGSSHLDGINSPEKLEEALRNIDKLKDGVQRESPDETEKVIAKTLSEQ